MRINRHIAVFSVMLLVGLAPGAAGQQVSPVQAKLVIPDAKVLPGVPFDMWIEVRNPSDATITIGLFPRLAVRADRGAAFEVTSGASDFPVLLRGSKSAGEPVIDYLTLAPGEKKTLTLPIREELQGAQFFRDYRLSPPGRYTLAMRLDAFPLGIMSEPVPLTFLGPVLTTEATVERIEPTGADAKVWKRMQELANGRWALLPMTISSGASPSVDVDTVGKMTSVWGEILTKYPESNYIPYALLWGSGFDDQYTKRVLDAIERFPSSPVIEYLDARARNLTVKHAGMPGSAMAAAFARETAKIEHSQRPTTRIRVFGREDLPKEPCPRDVECEP